MTTEDIKARLDKIELWSGGNPDCGEAVDIARALLEERDRLREELRRTENGLHMTMCDAQWLDKEVATLKELLMDAVNQGAPRYGDNKIRDGAISAWETILPWLVDRGLAAGNEKEGYVLNWGALND